MTSAISSLPQTLSSTSKTLPSTPKTLPSIPQALSSTPKTLPSTPKTLPSIPQALSSTPKTDSASHRPSTPSSRRCQRCTAALTPQDLKKTSTGYWKNCQTCRDKHAASRRKTRNAAKRGPDDDISNDLTSRVGKKQKTEKIEIGSAKAAGKDLHGLEKQRESVNVTHSVSTLTIEAKHKGQLRQNGTSSVPPAPKQRQKAGKRKNSSKSAGNPNTGNFSRTSSSSLRLALPVTRKKQAHRKICNRKSSTSKATIVPESETQSGTKAHGLLPGKDELSAAPHTAGAHSVSMPVRGARGIHTGSSLSRDSPLPLRISNNDPKSIGVKEEPSVSTERECSICTNSHDPFVSLLGCEHEPGVCKPCFLTWLNQEIAGKRWNQVQCPSSGCRNAITHNDVQKYALADVFARFDELSVRAYLRSEPTFIYCLAPKCKSGQIHDSGAEGPIFRCAACSFRMCTAHSSLVAFHENEVCAQYNERIERERNDRETLKMEATRRKQEAASISKVAKTSVECPGCGAMISKVNGCDHMTCQRFSCGFEFCYTCRAPYSGQDGIRKMGNSAHMPDCRYHSNKLPGYDGAI